jgi:hypothetical protein
MAAYLRLVAYAAEALANELAPAGLSDGAAERGLAHTGRTDEAEDRALELVGPRLDRKIFDDPILDLLQPIMIGVEDRLGRDYVILEAALLPQGRPSNTSR